MMDSLPVEILCEIFKRLPETELPKVSTVCRKFCEIIEKFELITTILIQKSNDESHTPTRKYKKLIIKESIGTNYCKALPVVGELIQEVKFHNHESCLKDVADILNFLPNVKVVTFYYIHFDRDDEVVEKLEHTLTGVELKFYESNVQIFKIMHNMSIKSIDIQLYGDSPYYNWIDFAPFMKIQRECEFLSVANIFESNLLYHVIPSGPYKLKEFAIRASDLEEWIYLETYLSEHFDTLERLTVERSPWDPSIVVEQCPNLKYIELSEDVVANNIQKALTSVEELSIKLPLETLDKFPNVRKLSIEEASAEDNQAITANMSKVKNLSVRYGTLANLHLENVIKLKICSVNPIEPEFFQHYTKVENLELTNCYTLHDAVLESVAQNLKNLKVLRIHGMNDLTENAFEILKSLKMLKILEMSTWSQGHDGKWKTLEKEINGLQVYVEKFNF
jgi:F-box-like